MAATIPSLHDAVDEIQPGLVADRRHLHEHPELGMQEHETARFVADRLRQLGLEDIRTGIANTGVTALVRGTNPDGPGAGKVILLRGRTWMPSPSRRRTTSSTGAKTPV